MRSAVLVMLFALGFSGKPLRAQAAGGPVKPMTSAVQPVPLYNALSGKWTGVLEYRDYSEPAGSTKRVQLPTWLSVTLQPEGLRFRYVYDDGPNKVLEESEVVVFDTATRRYQSVATDSVTSLYAVAGLDTLKDGRGELVMTGPGKENDKPAEMRLTWTIRRNLLTMLEETRPAGSQEAFAFRHRYVFTRADPPAVTSAR